MEFSSCRKVKIIVMIYASLWGYSLSFLAGSFVMHFSVVLESIFTVFWFIFYILEYGDI